MTKTTKKNRIAAILLTLAMTLGMFSAFGVTNASAATDKVSLYSSNITFTKYGARTYEVFIQTRDNAYNQEVYVHYNYMDSLGWSSTKAEYVTTLNDGSKIWKAYFSSFNTQYAIKFVADGREYWDNNYGRDYNGTERLGTAPITAERSAAPSYNSNTFLVSAVLQNYAYNKNVFVRYTTDNWRTYKDQALNYSNTYDDGTECWKTVISDYYGAFNDNFQYALCYQVNGQEYWANNFGANYNGSFYIHH